MKNIFVTGASGFIGSHLVEKLVLQGYNVKALVTYNRDNSSGWLDTIDNKIKKEIDIITGDISDPFLLINKTKDCDMLFHLAALISIPYSYMSPLNFVNTNIKGTLNVLEAVKKNRIKHLVHTSTSEVYGTAKSRFIDEAHVINSHSPYAATKSAADQLVSSYCRSYNTPATIIRPFNTFGPRQSLRAVIPNIVYQINKSKNKKKIFLKLGNVNSRRDFTYIDDTVNAFVKCINNKKIFNETINLGTGYNFSINETIEFLQEIAQSKLVIISEKKRIRPKKSEVDVLISNNNKAKQILKWKPRYSGKKGFVNALKKTFDWYNNIDNLKFYKINKYYI